MRQSGQLTVEVVDDSAVAHATLVGELDLAECEYAWEVLEPLVQPDRDVVLDISGVTFVDSRGLSVLVRLLNALGESRLILQGPSPSIVRLLEIAGLRDLLTIE